MSLTVAFEPGASGAATHLGRTRVSHVAWSPKLISRTYGMHLSYSPQTDAAKSLQAVWTSGPLPVPPEPPEPVVLERVSPQPEREIRPEPSAPIADKTSIIFRMKGLRGGTL